MSCQEDGPGHIGAKRKRIVIQADSQSVKRGSRSNQSSDPRESAGEGERSTTGVDTRNQDVRRSELAGGCENNRQTDDRNGECEIRDQVHQTNPHCVEEYAENIVSPRVKSADTDEGAEGLLIPVDCLRT